MTQGMNTQETLAMYCDQMETLMIQECKYKADILRQLTTHAVDVHNEGKSKQDHTEFIGVIRGYLERSIELTNHEGERLEYLRHAHDACAELIKKFPDTGIDYSDNPKFQKLFKEEMYWSDKFSGTVPGSDILNRILGQAMQGQGPGTQVVDMNKLFGYTGNGNGH